MKIDIQLNQKSIQEAKKKLLQVKKALPLAINDFLEDVALWLIDRANFHLNNSDIGENVKIEIRNGWVYNFTASGIKITNSTDKAVFVEFGVGIVGQADEHPQASTEGYEYNVTSPYKDSKGSGTWIFKSKMQDLDIPQSQADFIGDGTEYVVITKGTKGVWYAYNAIQDAKMELTRPNGGEIGALWDKAKRKYIK
jgi:hypothetical protein